MINRFKKPETDPTMALVNRTIQCSAGAPQATLAFAIANDLQSSHAWKPESHCRTERGAQGGIDGHQPVLPPCGDVRELEIREVGGLYQEAVHRRDEARRDTH